MPSKIVHGTEVNKAYLALAVAAVCVAERRGRAKTPPLPRRGLRSTAIVRRLAMEVQ